MKLRWQQIHVHNNSETSSNAYASAQLTTAVQRQITLVQRLKSHTATAEVLVMTQRELA